MAEIVVGSHEWAAARAGRFTASRAPDLLSVTRNGQDPGAPAHDLIAEFITIRLTGDLPETFVTQAMQRGIDLEPDAIGQYELMHDADVLPARIVDHPTMPNVAATPDGFVGDDGLIEVKCPMNKGKHFAALLLSRGLDETDRLCRLAPSLEYMAQVQFQLWVTERAWCDLVSYDPRFNPPHHIAVKRVFADPSWIGRFQQRIDWVEDRIAEAMALFGVAEAAE